MLIYLYFNIVLAQSCTCQSLYMNWTAKDFKNIYCLQVVLGTFKNAFDLQGIFKNLQGVYEPCSSTMKFYNGDILQTTKHYSLRCRTAPSPKFATLLSQEFFVSSITEPWHFTIYSHHTSRPWVTIGHKLGHKLSRNSDRSHHVSEQWRHKWWSRDCDHLWWRFSTSDDRWVARNHICGD